MSKMDQIISCQISFIPINEGNINLSVDRILKLVETSGIEYKVGMMSTELKGERESLMQLINQMMDYALKNTKFILDIRFSNQCGI